MELRAPPEVETSSEVVGYRMMDLRSKHASDKDLPTSVAEMTIRNTSVSAIPSRFVNPYVLQPGALHYKPGQSV